MVDSLEYFEIIRALREDNDSTQQQIAEVLEIKQASYSQYELNKRELPIRFLKRLCEYYGVSADYILNLPDSLKYPKR